jgi:hypothetical protein
VSLLPRAERPDSVADTEPTAQVRSVIAVESVSCIVAVEIVCLGCLENAEGAADGVKVPVFKCQQPLAESESGRLPA